MLRLRSLLAIALAAIATVLVGCSSPSSFKTTPTYTPEQISQIQLYSSRVQELRDRMPELATAITDRNWSDVQSFIHGPLGELRAQMARVSRNLLSPAQSQADELAKDLANHLVRIDEVAETQDSITAAREYQAALNDFDQFLQLVSGI